MKKIMNKTFILLVLCALVLVGCSTGDSRPKYKYTKDYEMVYFYIPDCPNCKHFREEVLPIIKEEFGKHMKIKAYDLDDDSNNNEVKTIYDSYVNKLEDFKEDDYGYGPFVVVKDYLAILGAGNSDDYTNNLSKALRGKKMGKKAEVETRYFFENSKVKR